MPNLEFKINPDVYLAQMHQQTTASLGELRNTLRALDDGSFAQRASLPRPQSVVSFQINQQHDVDEEAIHQACASCFLGLVRALITFIDRIVAVQRLLGQTIQIPGTITSLDELQTFLDNQLEETYTNVARDTRLTNPAKLNSLGIASDFVKNAALSYFSLRRALEHHNGISDKDIHLLYSKLTILAGKKEITQLPYFAEEGAQISMKLDDSGRTFPMGDRVQLTEHDIEQIFFTIQSVIGPQIRQTVGPA